MFWLASNINWTCSKYLAVVNSVLAYVAASINEWATCEIDSNSKFWNIFRCLSEAEAASVEVKKVKCLFIVFLVKFTYSILVFSNFPALF
jgi:hypothetical protein